MAVKNSKYPKWSDWSMPESGIPQNTKTIDVNQSHSSDHQTKKFKSPKKPVESWKRMSPCVQGLLLGILMNGWTLAIVLILWLIPHYKTGGTVTNDLPPGTILLFSGNLSSLVGSTYPWLLCNGSEVSRLTYQNLFDVIGVTYGSGNGIDTFNLPDFRARFPLGSTGSNDSQLVAGGASSHTMTIAEMPVHTHSASTLQILSSGQHSHTFIDPGHNHGGSTGSGPFSNDSNSMASGSSAGNDNGAHSHTIPNGTTGITIRASGNHTHAVQGQISLTGASQPIDMMPPYQTIHYIIRA